MSINAMQRTRRERRSCNRCVPWAGSLSLGRSAAAGDWMVWADGTRVRGMPHPFWPDGCSRVTSGRVGPLTMVWLVFDRAVRDGDGDGPYREGEILSEYLASE